MEDKKIRLTFMNYVALCAACMVSGAPGLAGPAIATCIEAFPDVPTATIRMLSTLPNLISMFVGLGLGTVVGKKIPYRTVSITGALLVLIGGIGPFFFHSNWGIVLMFRAILGLGVATGTYKAALIMRSVPADRKAQIIGYGQSATNLMMVIIQPITGMLADIKFYYAFLVYIVIAFIFVIELFFLKEPPKEEMTADTETKESDKTPAVTQGKRRIAFWIFPLAVISFLNITCLYAFNTGISSYVVDKNIGTAVAAGTALSVYTFAGMLGNVFLKQFTKIFGRFSIAVTDACIMLGLILLVMANGMPVIFAAAVLCGFGYIVGSTSLQYAAGRVAYPATLVLSTSIITCASGGGSFLSSYYIGLAHSIVGAQTEVQSAYILSIFVFAALAVFGVICSKKLYGTDKEE